jgi:hypothetical protein
LQAVAVAVAVVAHLLTQVVAELVELASVLLLFLLVHLQLPLVLVVLVD